MKFLLRTVLIAGLSFVGLRMFDWWIIIVVAFVVCLLLSDKSARRLYGKKKAPTLAFLSGFIAIALVWGIMAWLLDAQNGSLLSQKIYQILLPGKDLGVASQWIMILLTASIGGLLGGSSAMTGNLLGKALRR